MNIQQRIAFFKEIAVMVPAGTNDESMRIDYVDEETVYATGEDTGEQYSLPLEEIDMNDYIFYQLVITTPKSLLGIEEI